jgi:hypothetical protein
MSLDQMHRLNGGLRPAVASTANPPAIAYLTIFLAGLLAAATVKTMHDYIVELDHRELVRVTSPDGSVDAVSVRPIVRYFNAPSALYLVRKQDPAPAWGPVLRLTEDPESPRLVWKGPQLLEVQFERGCVEGFTNLWHSNDIEGGRYYIEIRLAPSAVFSCLKSTPEQTALHRIPFLIAIAGANS